MANVLAMYLEKISDMLKKNFVYLGLDKKDIKKLRAGFDKFIKIITFTICFCYLSLPIFTKLALLTFKSK